MAQWESVYRKAWGPEFGSPCPKPSEKHLPVIPELGKVEAGGWLELTGPRSSQISELQDPVSNIRIESS